MENASEALKMATAVLIFAGALTITIFAFTKAREASTNIMAQSEKNRTYYNVENPQSDRVVGIDAVISNMYSYYQTQNTIVFFTGKLDPLTNKLDQTSIEKMAIYESNVKDEEKLNSSSLRIINSRNICGLDIKDENIREEPWTGSVDRTKQFIDYLINKTFITDDFFRDLQWKYNLGGKSFIDSNGAKFVERIGEYNTDLETEELIGADNNKKYTDQGDVEGQFSNLAVESSIIRFEGTDETIDNSKGDKEKVIEYIYIIN